MSLSFCVIALVVSATPGAPAALQYDRAAVASGEAWRVITGQMVHWSGRMTFADLAMVAVFGSWIEARSRRAVVVTLVAALALTALAVHLGSPQLRVYRGSSGVAVAMVTVSALGLCRDTGPVARVAGAVLLIAVVAKTVVESVSGAPLVAGPMPEGVAVVPMVHLAGGVAGALAFVAGRGERRLS